MTACARLIWGDTRYCVQSYINSRDCLGASGQILGSSLKTGADKLSKMILQSPERNRQRPDRPDNHSEIQLTHFADFQKSVFSFGLSQFQWIPQPFFAC